MKYFLYLILLIITINISALSEKQVYKYSLDTIYSTMIRYIVINQNSNIVKKDIEGAYIIFESKDIKGKIELIKRGKDSVEMVLDFEGAHYKLILFMKKFNEKLNKEQNFKEKE